MTIEVKTTVRVVEIDDKSAPLGSLIEVNSHQTTNSSMGWVNIRCLDGRVVTVVARDLIKAVQRCIDL